MVYSPLPTAYPSIPSGVWTKVNTRNPETKKHFVLANHDTTNAFRFLKLPVSLTSASVNATYGATAGKILAPASDATHVGGTDEETKDNISIADIWVYQASGGALATLAVDEGV